MKRRFDDLWSSAPHDGASCPVRVIAARPEDGEEADLMIDAWYRERAVSIECSLLLDQARQMIANLLADDRVTPERQRQARRLLRVMRDAQSDGRGGP